MTPFSVIIPAHNEAHVIARCLFALSPAAITGEAEVVVVCNGCTDETATIARSVGEWVKVIETPVASKPVALNMGDAEVRFFPRVYVDADVVLSAAGLRLLVKRLRQGPELAAAPAVRLDLAAASWPVRQFYAVDRRLPWAKQGIGGSGVYALSAEGRGRFDAFPAITADDGYVRLQFAPNERALVDDATSIVTPPRRLGDLIAIKSRSHFGTYELRDNYGELFKNVGEANTWPLIRLATNPCRWVGIALYSYVKLIAKRRARAKCARGHRHQWERDESSRRPQ